MTSKDFVTSYFEAWNQHDAGGVAEHLSRSGKYCDIPVQQEWNRDEFIEHLNSFFAQDRNRYSLLGEIHTAKNSIAFQYRASPIDSDDDSLDWMGQNLSPWKAMLQARSRTIIRTLTLCRQDGALSLAATQNLGWTSLA